jgi:hypothetical protein
MTGCACDAIPIQRTADAKREQVLALDCVNCADHIAVLYLLLYLEQERNDTEATTL